MLRDALTSTDDRIVRTAARALWGVTALDDDDQRLLLHHANRRFRWAMRRRRVLRRLTGGPMTADQAKRIRESRRPVSRSAHLAVSIGASVGAVGGLLAANVAWPLVALSVIPAALVGQFLFAHLLAAVPGLPWHARSPELSEVAERVQRREGRE